MNGCHPEPRPTPNPGPPWPGLGTEELLLWEFGWCLALVAAVSAVLWKTGQIAGLLFGHGRPAAPKRARTSATFLTPGSFLREEGGT